MHTTPSIFGELLVPSLEVVWRFEFNESTFYVGSLRVKLISSMPSSAKMS